MLPQEITILNSTRNYLIKQLTLYNDHGFEDAFRENFFEIFTQIRFYKTKNRKLEGLVKEIKDMIIELHTKFRQDIIRQLRSENMSTQEITKYLKRMNTKYIKEIKRNYI